MRIAVCGGSFDPFHWGHLDSILGVQERMEWDRVIYVPAFLQPFKSGGSAASGYHRFAMAVLTTRNEDVHVSPMELERGGVSYTVDTLEELHRHHPGATFDWIIGEDNVSGLPKWRNIDRILELARFVVLTRETSEAVAPPSFPEGAIIYAHNRKVPVSATEIRRRLRAGEPIGEFVDPLVARYIHHNGLYREARE
jgi:nicotinate-nucleotide adenylyltransferase